ncbi:MAG: substrate-binding domain-containing protein [Campylobacterales bacterium]|nr:substrate-binding domain-containing protein [Campylobacterales bacterium]
MRYLIVLFLYIGSLYAQSSNKIVYLVSDIRIPFWNIMAKGIENKANTLGYEIEILSANNIKKNEMQNLSKALKDDIKGLIISPINSSTAATILKLAKLNNKPVVISDIGTDSGDYVSFISSDNFQGAYEIGKILALKMKQLGWDKDGSVGIISIPQKRANGKARTAGFMEALNEYGIKGAGLLQQVDFSHQETYQHSMTLIKNNPNLKALWLQGSDRYKAALEAIKDSGKEGEILLLCFDAEPEFLDLIPKGVLVGAAMQQPYLMGQKAIESLHMYLNGEPIVKNNQLEVLAVSTDNIQNKLDIIKTNVLGIEKP